MGVFKNDVGRPSNKTIRIRRIIVSVVIIILLIIIMYLASRLNLINTFNNSKATDFGDKKSNVSTTTFGKDNVTLESTINIYGHLYDENEYGKTYIDISNEDRKNNVPDTKYDLLGSYKCTNKDCTLLNQYSYDLSTVWIKDDKFVVYNFKTQKAKNVNLSEKETERLNKYIKENDIFVNSNIDSGKTYYELNFNTDLGSAAGLIDSELNVVFIEDDENNIYDSKTGAKYFYYLNNGNVMYTRNNKINTYDIKSHKLSLSKEYEEALFVKDGYIVVIDGGYLKVLDIKQKEVATLTKVTKDIKIHTMLSGWYTENKKEGMYVVVQDPSVKYADLSDELKNTLGGEDQSEYTDYGYEYYYIPTTGEVGKIPTFIGGYAKPVLYLYPKSDNTKVEISFEKPELLTTTYPKYKSSWKVTADKNGDLKDSDGKYYYGLYWEESGYVQVDFKEGFYVTDENAIDFLEKKLSQIGLNDRERNEFIMYWLPILEKNKKNLVYFELTSSRQNYNRLIINPKPDSLLRVAIHVKKVNNKTDIKEEKLPKFKRNGFTAVEWGGVIHK